MMPWPLFDRFMAAGARLKLAIKYGEPTTEFVADQQAILQEWAMIQENYPSWRSSRFSWWERLAAKWRRLWRVRNV